MTEMTQGEAYDLVSQAADDYRKAFSASTARPPAKSAEEFKNNLEADRKEGLEKTRLAVKATGDLVGAAFGVPGAGSYLAMFVGPLAAIGSLISPDKYNNQGWVDEANRITSNLANTWGLPAPLFGVDDGGDQGVTIRGYVEQRLYTLEGCLIALSQKDPYKTWLSTAAGAMKRQFKNPVVAQDVKLLSSKTLWINHPLPIRDGYYPGGEVSTSAPAEMVAVAIAEDRGVPLSNVRFIVEEAKKGWDRGLTVSATERGSECAGADAWAHAAAYAMNAADEIMKHAPGSAMRFMLPTGEVSRDGSQMLSEPTGSGSGGSSGLLWAILAMGVGGALVVTSKGSGAPRRRRR